MARTRYEIQTLNSEISHFQSQNMDPAYSVSSSNDESTLIPNFHRRRILRQLLDQQVELGFKRRDNKLLNNFFDECSVHVNINGHDCKVLHEDQLLNSLKKVGVLHIPSAKSTLQNMDLNNDGFIDFEEFRAAAQASSPLSQWAKNLPLAEIFADAIPTYDAGKDPLRTISSLSCEERNAVCEAFIKGVSKMLDAECLKLSGAYKKVDEKKSKAELNSAAAKYGVYAMSCGRVHDYYTGLVNRVGHPHLRFEEAMQAEHCTKAGFDHSFVTNNYKIKTTPRREWEITVEYKVSDLTGVDVAFNRRLLQINIHKECPLVQQCELKECEVIAVVLYTGPMFFVYNCILRRWPKVHFEVFSNGRNTFATTINVLVSAVQKVSRSVKLPEQLALFRGLGGEMDLPDHFHKADEQGRRGFLEVLNCLTPYSWESMLVLDEKQILCFL